MFSFAQLKDGLKSLPVDAEVLAGLSPCQVLELKARQLKFNSYNHFRQFLKKAPPDQFGDISLALMRDICQKRLPERGSVCFEFTSLSDGVAFYSRWVGWDKKGNEVRVPRPIDGFVTVPRLRATVDHPIYVVTNSVEYLAWLFVWHGMAYLPEELAKAHLPFCFRKDHLVEEDPPTRAVRSKYRRSELRYGNVLRGQPN